MSDQPHDQELDELRRMSRHLLSELHTLQARIDALEARRAESRQDTESPPPPDNIPNVTTVSPSPSPSPGRPHGPSRVVEEHVRSPVGETETRDMEQLIGQTWLNRVGAVVLFLAAVFFIKFAFDQGWLSPTARVGLAAVVGLGMIGLGEFCLARRMGTFAAGVLGCGVGICYLAAFGAYNFYHLVGSETALILYTTVTALSIAVSVHGRLLPVAILAVIGGYGTPIALDTGSNQQIALLTYVLILDVGILMTGAYRRWGELRVLAWLGTLGLFGGWYFEHYTDIFLWSSVGFCLVFYVLFHGEMFLCLRRRATDQPRAIGTLLHFNNAVFFVSIYGLAHDAASEWMGLFAVVCGGLQWLGAWLARGWGDKAGRAAGESSVPTRVRADHALWQDGAAMLALAAPLQFDRYMVSVSWAVQAAITFWFCRRIPHVWLRLKGLGVFVAAAVHLVVYDHGDFVLSRVVWSVGQWEFSWIVACFVFVGVCGYGGAAALVSRRAALERDRVLGALLVGLGSALMLGIFAAEWERYIAAWWWIGLTVLWWAVGLRAKEATCVAIALAAVVCVKFLSYDTILAVADGSWKHIEGIALNRAVMTGMAVALLAAMLQSTAARCAVLFTRPFAEPRTAKAIAALTAAAVITWTMTFELVRVFRFEALRHSFEDSRLAMHVAISIAWSLNAAVLLVIGFSCNRKELRYGALLLFALTVAKVSVFDVSHLEMVYRIISFAVLGVLLLSASLLYQRRSVRRSGTAPVPP